MGLGRKNGQMWHWAAWWGWWEERWGGVGHRPQATQFRCIPAPGTVASAHSPPLEPRASFQVPSAASSPARVSDPLHALSPRGTPRSLSLSRILCRQVRETFASQALRAPWGSPFRGLACLKPRRACAKCILGFAVFHLYLVGLGSSTRWFSIIDQEASCGSSAPHGAQVPFLGKSLKPEVANVPAPTQLGP